MNSETEQSINTPRLTLILIALIQGLALFLVDEFMETKYWQNYPDTPWLASLYSPKWVFSLYGFVLAFPLFLILGLRQVRQKEFVISSLFYSLLVFGLCFYTGSQFLDFSNYYEAAFRATLSLGISCFLVLIYLQSFNSKQPFEFQNLLALGQKNLLTGSIAVFFLGIVWAILMLWAALFGILDIGFFEWLFSESWFAYLASTTAFAVGVILVRQQLIQAQLINRIQQVLARFLLIVLTSLALSFLVALSIKGLTPLWENGGSFLILSVQILILVFIHMAYVAPHLFYDSAESVLRQMLT